MKNFLKSWLLTLAAVIVMGVGATILIYIIIYLPIGYRIGLIILLVSLIITVLIDDY